MGYRRKKNHPRGKIGVIQREITGERPRPRKADDDCPLDAKLRKSMPNEHGLLRRNRIGAPARAVAPTMARPIGRQHPKTGCDEAWSKDRHHIGRVGTRAV